MCGIQRGAKKIIIIVIVSPYLGAGTPTDVEGARRQQLMLQTQLAKNLFKMGQFGMFNLYHWYH